MKYIMAKSNISWGQSPLVITEKQRDWILQIQERQSRDIFACRPKECQLCILPPQLLL